MPLSQDYASQAISYLLQGSLTITLLASVPDGPGIGAGDSGRVPLSSLSIATWPSASFYTESTAQVALCWNDSVVDFGTVQSPITVLGIGVYDANDLVGWCPLISASGHQVTRSFEVGDALRIPASALSLGIAL